MSQYETFNVVVTLSVDSLQTMKKPSIVVAADAGAAGRSLLEHDDLSIWWALTSREVRAALQHPFDLIVTREELADVALEGNKADVLVLLEPDSWGLHDQYFKAGATGLVQASNSARVVEAVSELTGVAFAEHPWVEVSEFVSVRDSDLGFVRVLRLSQGGLELEMADLRFQQGQRLVLELDFLPGAPAVPCAIVRMPDKSRSSWGLAFETPDEAVVSHIKKFVGSISSDLPSPVSLTADLGTCTLDLMMRPEEDKKTAECRSRLKAVLQDDKADRIPRWIRSLKDSLTPLEMAVLSGDRIDPMASEAIDIRLELGMIAVDQPADLQLNRRTQRVIEFARSLALTYEEADASVLLDVMRMRAALLAGVYRLDSKRRHNVSAPRCAV